MTQTLLKRAALALAIVFAFAGAALAAPTFPQLTGRVVDGAHVLSPDVQAQLTQKLADLEQRTSRQLVVVTLPSLQGYEIEDYGYQLGRAWGIGQKKLNNGVLFIIAPNEHRTRIEVGYGLEPILTDALSSVILQERVLPKFKSGDMQGGIVAGTDAIVQQLLLDAPAAKARVAEAEKQVKDQNSDDPFTAIFVFIVIMIIVGSIFRRGGGMGMLPWIILGSMGGGRRDGWGGGSGWGGGGFSGGGGSFGGGGASGSW
ncbi:MAG TPA: TPM domain-containing protein [Rhizomicrobium sp.]|nr:TPM domain-containing protein [Rhizomicrobium sp.]